MIKGSLRAKNPGKDNNKKTIDCNNIAKVL